MIKHRLEFVPTQRTVYLFPAWWLPADLLLLAFTRLVLWLWPRRKSPSPDSGTKGAA